MRERQQTTNVVVVTAYPLNFVPFATTLESDAKSVFSDCNICATVAITRCQSEDQRYNFTPVTLCLWGSDDRGWCSRGTQGPKFDG